MITVSTNILSLPLVLAIWALDSLLFLAAMRLTLRGIPRAETTGVYRSLRDLTDPIPRAIGRWVSNRRARSLRLWVSWVIFILGLIVGRCLMSGILALLM